MLRVSKSKKWNDTRASHDFGTTEVLARPDAASFHRADGMWYVFFFRRGMAVS